MNNIQFEVEQLKQTSKRRKQLRRMLLKFLRQHANLIEEPWIVGKARRGYLYDLTDDLIVETVEQVLQRR